MNSIKLKLFYIDTKYIEYLQEYEPHVWNSIDGRRPHIGVLVTIGNILYVAPQTSDRGKKYRSISHDFVINLYEKKTNNFVGSIILNNMIPVTESLISVIKVKEIRNEKFKNLLVEEIRSIRTQSKHIIDTANEMYSKYDTNNFYKILCFDFKKLENLLKSYLKNIFKVS